MNAVHILLAILALAAEPEPLDAFRANLASINVDMNFTFRGGHAEPAVVGHLSGLKEPQFEAWPDFGELNERTEIVGRWAYDGTTELYEFGSPDWVFRKLSDLHGGGWPKYIQNYASPSEGLFDGKISAFHRRTDPRANGPFQPIQVDLDLDTLPFPQGAGPFVWWRAWGFPALLDREVPGVEAERHASQRDGHPVEVEVYSGTRKILLYTSNTSRVRPGTVAKPAEIPNRIEISYDPAVGHLPRYARWIEIWNGRASVREMSLVEARRCSSGGFVPVEWYSTRFNVDGFATRYPSYDVETILKPTDRVTLTHFKASSFKDRTTPMALTHVDGHRALFSHHNTFLVKPGLKSLTMSDIKSILGPWRDDPTHPILPMPGARPPQGPDPDADPFHLRPILPWPVGVGFILVAGFLLVRHQKRRANKG